MSQTAGVSESVEPSELRMHPRHKDLPGPDRDSPQWLAFVLALSGAGPEGIPALVITPDNQIMDGERRWLAAKQLRWEWVPVVRRPESEVAVIIVDSLIGQRHLTKGAKVYLVVRRPGKGERGLLEDFIEAAEARRLEKLKKGVKTCEKRLIFPLAHSVRYRGGAGGQGKAAEQLGERLGASTRLVEQAIQVDRLFNLSAEHQFEFQDGNERTLKEHFEPQILDGERPMGLGEVLKGCGWFVDENGKPRHQAAPPERNSYLHYFESAFGNFSRQFGRWEKLKAVERERAVELVTAGMREWPAEVVRAVVEEGRKITKQQTSNLISEAQSA